MSRVKSTIYRRINVWTSDNSALILLAHAHRPSTHTHTHTPTYTLPHTHTHTHPLSLSLSHTHIYIYIKRIQIFLQTACLTGSEWFFLNCIIFITLYCSIGKVIRYLRGYTFPGGIRKQIAYPCHDNKDFFLCLQVDVSPDIEWRRLSFGDVIW